MGVPKFYRWISERYPTLSEVVKNYQIPEFDNLYLDMNGIIHTCSHPNDADPHFRITEKQIIIDIFKYIEALFRMIKPQKVFFMAIDGVAPRAKMNQQRGRRFRSAREAEDQEMKAVAKGEVLPKEKRFDSNCITPGTPFMDRLDKQLQYFVTEKISKNAMWQGCQVIYSGHQTPGEGEHKIMEYIRFMRSQPDYDCNTRHCLYGLDADLMMLGLTSHDPHFVLLREEVKFGRKEASKRTTTAEETTFHLLHLSLMREYINYEFLSLEKNISFEYNLENIIDDWVLMGFLVGNDFIPHLPTLHINKNALPLLFETYKSVMPKLDGYLNEGGKLNLRRFEIFMEKLAEYDFDTFCDMNADLKYFNAKKSNKTAMQRAGELENYYEEGNIADDNIFGGLEEDESASPEMETAAQTLAKLGIKDQPFMSDEELEEDVREEEEILKDEFNQHKRDYYKEKMGYTDTDKLEDVAKEQALEYVRGIQWILHYYYDGICSWSWYYPYHYSPYISDIKGFSSYPLDYELGRAFLPFEQLLAVLPPLSVSLLPPAYGSLMLNEDSPIIDSYPRKFETDLNGKQQDWEAVVLIPFIDENKLLSAMATLSHRLTDDENRRNSHGPMFVYSYTEENLGSYDSPQYFPTVSINHAELQLVKREEWELPREKIYKGLCENMRLDVYFQGFPSLQHIKHTFRLDEAGVKVFQQTSRGVNVILEVADPYSGQKQDKEWFAGLASHLINKVIYVDWPHLKPAKVVGISNGSYRVSILPGSDSSGGDGTVGPLVETDSQNNDKDEWGGKRFSSEKGRFDSEVRALQSQIVNRWGIDAKNSSVLYYCKPMTGKRYTFDKSGVMNLTTDWSHMVQPYLPHCTVEELTVFDPGYTKTKNVDDHFPLNSKVFMLGQPYYGSLCTVMAKDESKGPNSKEQGRVRLNVEKYPEPDLSSLKSFESSVNKYMTGYNAAQKLGFSNHMFVRITGTVLVIPPVDPTKPPIDASDYKNKVNIGFALKSNKKGEEVRGLTQRDSTSTWYYSDKCVQMVRDYSDRFPEVFHALSTYLNDLRQEDIFRGEDQAQRWADLKAWLKETEPLRSEKQRCGTEQLSPDSIDKLCSLIDTTTNAQRSHSQRMLVKPHLIYKSNPLQGSTPIDGPIKTQLWDRVTNVRDGFAIPLGARGTVVGIQPAKEQADVIYEIVFDKPFAGGISFGGGEESDQRCYRLHWSSFINISAKSRPESSVSEGAVGSKPLYSNEQQPFQRNWENARGSDNQYRGQGSNNQYRGQGSDNQYRGSNNQYRGQGSDNQYRGQGPDNQYRGQGSDNQYRGSDNQYRSGSSDNQRWNNSQQGNSRGSNNHSANVQQRNSPQFHSNNFRTVKTVESYSPSKPEFQGFSIAGNDQQNNTERVLTKYGRPVVDIAMKKEQKKNSKENGSEFPAQVEEVKENQTKESVSFPPPPALLPELKDTTQQSKQLDADEMNQSFLKSLLGQTEQKENEVQKENLQNVPFPTQLPQPPSPNALPTPFPMVVNRTPVLDIQALNKLPPNYLTGTPIRTLTPSTVTMTAGGILEVQKASDVPCICHGTFFSQWSVAEQYGLNKGKREHIPCLAYDPLVDQRQKDTGYQILIYLDVEACLQAGVKFLVLPAGNVLCTGDANGRILPHLFLRAIDRERSRTIFPRAKAEKMDDAKPVTHFMPTQVMRKATNVKKVEEPLKDVTSSIMEHLTMNRPQPSEPQPDIVQQKPGNVTSQATDVKKNVQKSVPRRSRLGITFSKNK